VLPQLFVNGLIAGSIVEQKVREVLKISRRAYLLKMGRVACAGASAEFLAGDRIREIFL